MHILAQSYIANVRTSDRRNKSSVLDVMIRRFDRIWLNLSSKLSGRSPNSSTSLMLSATFYHIYK